MINKFLDISNKIFLILFFPSFVTGLFLPNLLCGIFVITNILINFKKFIHLILYYRNIVSLFTIFCVIIFLSSLVSNYTLHSLESSALYITYLFYTFSFLILFKENIQARKLFFLFGMLTCFTLSIDAVYEFFNGSNLLGYYSIDGRLAGFFGDRWLLGRYLIYILPILVGLYFMESGQYKNYKTFIFFTFFLTSLTITFSGERAAFIMFFIYLFLILLFFFNKLSLYNLLKILLIIIILFITPFFFTETSTRLRDNFLIYLLSDNFEINQYLSMYLTSWRMFLENPLLGIGPNNFRFACSEITYYISKWSCSTHPHSTTFQVLAETGILGFIAVFSVLGYFVYNIVILIFSKKYSQNTFGKYSLQCSIIIYLFPFMITGNFFLSWYGFIYYLPISLFMVYSNKV